MHCMASSSSFSLSGSPRNDLMMKPDNLISVFYENKVMCEDLISDHSFGVSVLKIFLLDRRSAALSRYT